jgi:hypothetical protein
MIDIETRPGTLWVYQEAAELAVRVYVTNNRTHSTRWDVVLVNIDRDTCWWRLGYFDIRKKTRSELMAVTSIAVVR